VCVHTARQVEASRRRCPDVCGHPDRRHLCLANVAISGGRSPSAAWSSCTAFREDACQRSRLDTLQLHDEPDFTNMIPRRRKRADFAVGSEALARVESDRGQVRLADVEQ